MAASLWLRCWRYRLYSFQPASYNVQHCARTPFTVGQSSRCETKSTNPFGEHGDSDSQEPRPKGPEEEKQKWKDWLERWVRDHNTLLGLDLSSDEDSDETYDGESDESLSSEEFGESEEEEEGEEGKDMREEAEGLSREWSWWWYYDAEIGKGGMRALVGPTKAWCAGENVSCDSAEDDDSCDSVEDEARERLRDLLGWSEWFKATGWVQAVPSKCWTVHSWEEPGASHKEHESE